MKSRLPVEIAAIYQMWGALLTSMLVPLLIALIITLISTLDRPRPKVVGITRQPLLDLKAALSTSAPEPASC